MASLKFVAENIDLEDGSLSVIPARLACLVVGQPFQAVVVTGWKAGPTIGIPDSGTLHAAATREGDKYRIEAPAALGWC